MYWYFWTLNDLWILVNTHGYVSYNFLKVTKFKQYNLLDPQVPFTQNFWDSRNCICLNYPLTSYQKFFVPIVRPGCGFILECMHPLMRMALAPRNSAITIHIWLCSDVLSAMFTAKSTVYIQDSTLLAPHCWFLEHWNRQKSLSNIRQCCSCLSKEVFCLRCFLRLWKNNRVSRKPCKRRSDLVLNRQMWVPK